MLSPKASQHCSNLGSCESDLPDQHHHRHSTNGGHMRSSHNIEQKFQQTPQQHLSTNANRRGSTSNVLPSHMTTINNSSGTSAASNSTLRRKSSLCYQQQLLGSNPTNCSTNNLHDGNVDDSPERYSPHPNELFLQHHHHHQHGKLSLQPMERYDDSLACCLPPPSPAPNSDRFIGGTCVVSPPNVQAHPENHHHQQQAQSQQTLSSSTSSSSISTGVGSCSSSSTSGGPLSTAFQPVASHNSLKYNINHSLNVQRSISPSTTRFRINTERYRDLNATNSSPSGNTASAQSVVIPTATRFISSTTHYPYKNSTTPLVSTDTYSYLASSVHTPVKRYVPTPPPPNQLYASEQSHTHQQTIPTPTKASGSSSALATKCGVGSNAFNTSSGVGGSSSTSSSSSTTMPYRMRSLKCCAPDQMASDQQPIVNVNQTNDFYSSSPRSRTNYNCTKAAALDTPMMVNFNETLQATSQSPSLSKNVGIMSTQSSSTTQTHMVSTITGCVGSSGSASPQGNTSTTGATVRQQAPAYTTRSGICSAINDLQEPPSINQATANMADLNQSSNSCVSNALRNEETTTSSGAAVGSGSSSSTCLHCKTVRRTTGVHQTTQTTGPISPVPQMTPSLTTNNNNSSSNQRISDQMTNITMTLTPTPTESNHLIALTPPSSSMPTTNRLLSKKLDMASDQMFTTQLKVNSSQISQSHLSESNQHHQQLQQPNLEHFVPTSTRLMNQPQQQASQQLSQPQSNTLVQQQQRYSCKKRFTQYMRREILQFFGIETSTEADDYVLWQGRQRRLALRRFGSLKTESELQVRTNNSFISFIL